MVREGETLSIDGTSGQVFVGRIPTVIPTFDDPDLVKLLTRADKFRQLEVRANADYPNDAGSSRFTIASGCLLLAPLAFLRLMSYHL